MQKDLNKAQDTLFRRSGKKTENSICHNHPPTHLGVARPARREDVNSVSVMKHEPFSLPLEFTLRMEGVNKQTRNGGSAQWQRTANDS